MSSHATMSFFHCEAQLMVRFLEYVIIQIKQKQVLFEGG